MSSSRGSTVDDVEDWLDIGDNGSTVASLNLDDVLNEVENLDEGLSFTDDTIHDGDTGSISLLCESPSQSTFLMSYQLDSAIVVHSHQSISHQIQSAKAKSGNCVAIAERNGQIAVATTKGHILMFDLDGKLDRYHQSNEQIGGASCLAFSLDGKHLAVGYAKGAIKIMSVRTGKVYVLIEEAVQPGLGVLQILYISGSSSLLALDNGGSVYEIRFQTGFTGKKHHKIRCIFSGCNGEVINIRLLPNQMLALLTVSKLLLVSTRFGGAVLGSFPLDHSYQSPPLFAYWIGGKKETIDQSPIKSISAKSLKDLRICVCRGLKMIIFRLHVANFTTKNKSATLLKNITLPIPLVNLHWISNHMIIGIDENGSIWQIETEKFHVKKAMVEDLEIIFAISDFKGLANGGRVSEAMCCLAETACYPSITSATSTSDRLIILAHDGLKIVEKVTEWEQLERFRENDDEISASLYLLDVIKGKVRATEMFRKEAPNLLPESIRRLLENTTNGFKEGKIAQLIAHYKKFIQVILHVCITSKQLDILYDEVWNRLSLDQISKTILLESIDEYVLDGVLIEPPPTIVSEYLKQLAIEGHFSQFQSAVVRFPIHTIDIHSVMSTCRQNGLYDGIIYVMNNALNDYISPLEEMLEAVRQFASNEVLSDNEIDIGNRLLLYLNCCLAGRAYPLGMLDENQKEKVPLEVYRCICSLKGKDGSCSEENYPYLRLLLQFDPQQFLHVICTCADAQLFQTDGRLQRITDTIGLLCVSLRQESPLVHFLQLIVQFAERSLIVPPIELIQDSIVALLRIATWQHANTENAIITALRGIGNIDRTIILKAAQSPMRYQICGFVYLSERKFVDMVKCFLEMKNKEVFNIIDQILNTNSLNFAEFSEFTNFVKEIIPVLSIIDQSKCAILIIDHFPEYLRKMVRNDEKDRKEMFPILMAVMTIRRDRKQTTISGDEEVDEFLFGIVFEGICKQWFSSTDKNENIGKMTDEILMDLLSFWLPTGSRTDFCLNQAVENEKCCHTVVQLLEARGFLERAFDIIFEEMEKFSGFDETLIIHWLDEALAFCSRHSIHQLANEWILKVFRFVAITSSTTHNRIGITEKEKMAEKMEGLCKRVVDTGTEHAAQLVEALLECPSFANSNCSESLSLLTDILKACDYEIKSMENLLNVMNAEATEENKLLFFEIGRRSELTKMSTCITCFEGLNKSAYVFKCGHFQHIECSTSTDKICDCNFENHSIVVPRRVDPIIRPKKDIFVDWGSPLDLTPKPKKIDNL